MAYGTLNAGTITPGSGNTLAISEAVTVPTPTATTHAATKSYVDTAATQATTAAQGVGTGDSPTFAGLNAGDGNITNVGNIALDTISSDAGTSIGVTLGTDAGDDFNVGSGKLVVEGDTGNVGIGTTAPGAKLHINNGGDYYLSPNSGGTDIYVGSSQFIRWLVGGGNTEVLRVKSDGTLSGASSADISDERLKENIDTVSGALEKINQLEGRTFTWKTMAKMPAGVQYGMIAQEVGSILPELVLQNETIRVLDKDGNVKSSNEEFLETDEYCKEVQTSGLIPILIEAVKELSAKVTALENA